MKRSGPASLCRVPAAWRRLAWAVQADLSAHPTWTEHADNLFRNTVNCESHLQLRLHLVFLAGLLQPQICAVPELKLGPVFPEPCVGYLLVLPDSLHSTFLDIGEAHLLQSGRLVCCAGRAVLGRHDIIQDTQKTPEAHGQQAIRAHVACKEHPVQEASAPAFCTLDPAGLSSRCLTRCSAGPLQNVQPSAGNRHADRGQLDASSCGHHEGDAIVGHGTQHLVLWVIFLQEPANKGELQLCLRVECPRLG
mmetsp:Transcript_26622/g.82762  ORF Transcript_26622/g.82762 Transcript_26622/m.82762 type:complete len:250 (-) Transcript_26622:41-790(-)